MEDIQRERQDITEREEEIQRLLKETAERYEKLRAEAGLDTGPGSPAASNGIGFGSQRGLESLGGTPLRLASGVE